MWLLFHAKLCDIRTLIKIKAMQADLVKHLMKDERSLVALQAAHNFGNGLISQEELWAAWAAADAAADAADADAARAAARAADAARADAVAWDAVAAVAWDAVAADAARNEILMRCADIVRQVIPSVKIDEVVE